MNICCVYIRNNINSSTELSHYQLRYDIMPLGISYISSCLQQAGHTTELLYCNPFNCNNDITKYITNIPKLFAISIVADNDFLLAIKLISILKKKYPNSNIIIGGTYPTLTHENILETYKDIDAICIGAGEKAVVEYVKQLENNSFVKTDNLYIKNNNKIIKCDQIRSIEDLDSIPYPDRNGWKRWIKLTNRHKISLGRGCKYGCIYCSNKSLSKVYNNNYLNHRKVENVIDEIKFIKKEYPEVETIYFDDENSLADINFFKKLCVALNTFNTKLDNKINFSLKVNFTPNLLEKDIDIIPLIKNANINWLQFALESASLEIRKKLYRPFYTNEQILKFFNILNKHNIKTMCYIMYCYPFETKQTFLETVHFLRQVKPNIIEFAVLTPIQNTELYNLLKTTKYRNFNFVDKYRVLTFRWQVYKTYKPFMEAIFLSIEPFKIFSIIVNILKKYKKYKTMKQQNYQNMAKYFFNKQEYKKAIKFFDKIQITDYNQWIYKDRAIAKMNIEDFNGALEDFNKIHKNDFDNYFEKKRLECINKLIKK